MLEAFGHRGRIHQQARGSAFVAPQESHNLVDETENALLRAAVKGFLNGITYLYWDPIYSLDYLDPAQEPWRAELQGLNAQSQYIGHQLVSVNFRSFDLQSSTTAVVTVREIWSDKLYSYSGYPNYYSDPVVGERGPYTLDVTYTLEMVEGNWRVTQAVYSSAPPGW